MVRFLPALFLVAPIVGCGGDPRVATVSGTVTYKGKPLPNAYVAFWPEKQGERAATGSTDANGRYRLTTYQAYDGAVIGKHGVMIRAEEVQVAEGPPKAADDITLKRGKLLTPPRYSNAVTSGLTALVAPKNNVIDFDLQD
jgi:hypothetical protein